MEDPSESRESKSFFLFLPPLIIKVGIKNIIIINVFFSFFASYFFIFYNFNLLTNKQTIQIWKKTI